MLLLRSSWSPSRLSSLAWVSSFPSILSFLQGRSCEIHKIKFILAALIFAARLLSSALEVTSIYYTFWLSRGSDLRLICPSRFLLRKKKFSSHCSLVTINDGIEPIARLWVCILLCKLRSGINRMNKYPP